MKKNYFALFFMLATIAFWQVKSQNLKRSTLSSCGSSTVVSALQKTLYISQSIGQTSVIGNLSKGNYTIRQGFQQPPVKVKAFSNPNEIIEAIVFPNPVDALVNINFKQEPKTAIKTTLYDTSGKVVMNAENKPSTQMSLDMTSYPSGVYILTINAENKVFTTQLIKK